MRDPFENLSYSDEIVGESRDALVEEIYARTYKTFSHTKRELQDYTFVAIEDFDFSPLEKLLSTDTYYILHDYTIEKSKKIKMIGRLVVSSKSELLKFVVIEKRNHEEMSFIVFPQDKDARFVLVNSEDWDFYCILS